MLYDFLNFKKNTPSKSGFAVLINPCFYSLILYRISHLLYKMKIPLIPKILWFINRIIFSVDIDYRAKIGKNFGIIHGLNIVIGKNVIIGNNVKIYQNVTIGGTGKSKLYKDKFIDQPIIKDNCIIYTNSCLLGPIIIGENCKIGAGSIITKDIKKNSIVFNKGVLVIKENTEI